MIPVNLVLRDALINGNNPRRDITNLFLPNWRRSIRRIGGFWLGTTDIDTTMTDGNTQVNRDYLDDFFARNILYELREYGGGMESWRGFISKMDYTRGDRQYTMDITPCANHIRALYTRVFDNLVTNGDCESGAWAAYNSPTSVAQYNAWQTGGQYSMKIVSPGGVTGATVDATVTISAGITYTITGNLRAISGSWRFGIDTAGGAKLVSYSTHAVLGDHRINISIPNSNTYNGTITVRITSEGTAGEIWADDIVVQRQSVAATTGWQSDLDAISMLGRKEDILLEASMSDEAAQAKVASQIHERAWPQTSSPPQYQTRMDVPQGVDKLSITFTGYWAMLNWLYNRITGTAAISDHIKAILNNIYVNGVAYDGISGSFVSVLAGTIDTNTLSYTIDTNTPYRDGDVLREMAMAGQANGLQRWSLGVYEDRLLNYNTLPPTPQYILQGNQVRYIGGGNVEPWFVRPGWVINEDMPLGAFASQYVEHDPRWEFIEEVEMKSDGTLTMNKEGL